MRFATLVIATSLLGAGIAHADRESSRLFEEGKELSRQGKYQQACDRFARSYELEPATGTQVNMADCEEHLGHIARAWQLFDAAANRSDREDNGVRAQYARRRASALLPRLGAVILTIDGASEDMKVSVGDRDYMPGPEIRAYVDPGEVEVRVQAPGKQFKKTIRVGAGESSALTVELSSGASRASTAATTTTATTGGKRRGWVIAAGVIGGAGVAGLGTSAVLTILASRGYGDTFADGECTHTSRGPECTDAGLSRVADARSVANIATGVAIAGTAAVVAGFVVYLLAPKTSFEVAPAVSDGGASVSVGGRF